MRPTLFYGSNWDELSSDWKPELVTRIGELNQGRAKGQFWMEMAVFMETWTDMDIVDQNTDKHLEVKRCSGSWQKGKAAGCGTDVNKFYTNPQFWLICSKESIVTITLRNTGTRRRYLTSTIDNFLKNH